MDLQSTALTTQPPSQYFTNKNLTEKTGIEPILLVLKTKILPLNYFSLKISFSRLTIIS